MSGSQGASLNEATPLVPPEQKTKENFNRHNVILSLIVVTIVGFSESIWASGMIVAFINIMTGKNEYVGYAEATTGIAQLVTALPVGYLADKYSRSLVIKLSSVLFVIGGGATGFAVIHGAMGHSEASFVILLMSLAIWGLVDGVISGPLQALFADSIPQGNRSKYYVLLFSCYILSSCAGPALTILIFTFTEDQWRLGELKVVILVGLGIEMLVIFFLPLFDEKKVIHEEPNPNPKNSKGDESKSNRVKYVPYIMFSASLLSALGSGMTVKFFPLYFKNDCKLSPRSVQGVYVAVPIAMVVMSGLSQRASRTLGRVPVILICRSIGIAALFAMVLLAPTHTNWKVMVPIYVLRASVLNCTYPLEEAILMDCVPKNQRARWKSVGSVAQFGWCGSAALGGILSDRHGYTFTFLITACMQACGTVLFALLIPLVPREEHSEAIEAQPSA